MRICIEMKVTQFESYSALFKFSTHYYAVDEQTRYYNEEFIVL
jgi:hypothetical protein